MNDCGICLLEPARPDLYCAACGEYCCAKCWSGETCCCCWAEMREAENQDYDNDPAAF